MIFPIGDDNSDRTTTPLVNYVLIAINILVFVFFQGMGGNDQFTYAYSAVPAEIVTGQDKVTPDRVITDPVSGDRFRAPGLQPTPLTVYLTLLTSMFMHGGWAHLFGNMLFLWIFGDNLEDRLGRARYLIFYLVCGIIASLAHVFTTYAFGDNLNVPSLGASGAISGVLGGYLLLFPHRRVRVILFRFLTEVPAYVAVGLWFVFQLVSGLGLLGGGSQEGGVAYAAHIGGFIAGLILIKFFAIGRSGGGVNAPARGF
ncbi:MAG TPA: rhomboid family intramembrane serine protease [Pyrinomonadaceae bacterium]|jgi:membrane associated rhomboid family serine protease|nr:rhomboid family intramembrane serine protease [Pyrinomonadaceae bacterium]